MRVGGGMRIRNETTPDLDAIARVTALAFRDQPHSRQTEPFIVQALREADALTLSLVAEMDGAVVGHVAFSPVTMSDGTPGWYGLGPISVHPEHQRKGIGSALIVEGLSRLKGLGARGCALVGAPGYYGRFGFRNHPALAYPGVPPEVFLAMPFDGHVPRGHVTFHPAFAATE